MLSAAPQEFPSSLEDFTAADEPLSLFTAWFEEAKRSEPEDPNAMTLATVDGDGNPNARMVLLKGFDERGFLFFTNSQSRKGRELDARPQAALVFHWKSLTRQVRVRGMTEVVDPQEADRYFASRHRQSKIGAWASLQSRSLESRSVLEEAIAALSERWPDEVPRPPHWDGFRLAPSAIEFWHQRAFRLHDRIEFTRTADDQPWRKTRLYP